MKTTTFNIGREILIWIALLVPFVFVAVKWADFPDRIPTHWNIHNEVDSWSSKPTLWLFPAINVGLYLLLLFIPRLDPKKTNYEKFGKAYFLIRITLHFFFAGLVIVTSLASLGYTIDIGRVVMGGCCLLFLVMGNVMGTVKHNFFVGIRTPWTLSDEEVWTKTHRLASRTWVAGALLAGVLLLLPGEAASIAFMVCVGAMTLVPIIYSYIIFRKKKAHHE